MQNIFWTGYCSRQRIVALSEIEQIISAHGYITDIKQFSDIAFMFRIELEEFKIDDLYEALMPYMGLDAAETLRSSSARERVIFLNITFTTGKGDLKTEIPAVPG